MDEFESEQAARHSQDGGRQEEAGRGKREKRDRRAFVLQNIRPKHTSSEPVERKVTILAMGRDKLFMESRYDFNRGAEDGRAEEGHSNRHERVTSVVNDDMTTRHGSKEG